MPIPILVLTAYDFFIRKDHIHIDVGWTYMVFSWGEPHPCYCDPFDCPDLTQSKI